MNKELNKASLEYRLSLFFYLLAAFCSLALSASFLVVFSTNGKLDPSTWDNSETTYAVIMLLLTTVVTAFLFYLYQGTKINPWYKVLAIIIVAGFFSGGSEVGTQMQRHDEILMDRSADSQEYKQAVAGIGQAVSASVSSGASPALLKAIDKQAKASAEIQACSRYSSQARRDKCKQYESTQYHRASAQIKAIKSSESTALASNAKIAENMAELAKELSHNDKYSLAIVKFLMSFGISLMVATLLIAAVMIGAFEMGFHGLGGIYRAKKDSYFSMLKKTNGVVEKDDTPALLNDPEKPRKEHKVLDGIEQDKSAFEAFKNRWAVDTQFNGAKALVDDRKQAETALQMGATNASNDGVTKGYDGGDSSFGFKPRNKPVTEPLQAKRYTHVKGVTGSYKKPVTVDTKPSPACITRQIAVTERGSVTEDLPHLDIIRNAILKQGVTPTVRSMRWFLGSESIGVSMRDRDNIGDAVYPDLVTQKVLMKQKQKKGIKKAKYSVNIDHPEYVKKADPSKVKKS